jgi:hypothetical protein
LRRSVSNAAALLGRRSAAAWILSRRWTTSVRDLAAAAAAVLLANAAYRYYLVLIHLVLKRWACMLQLMDRKSDEKPREEPRPCVTAIISTNLVGDSSR